MKACPGERTVLAARVGVKSRALHRPMMQIVQRRASRTFVEVLTDAELFVFEVDAAAESSPD